MSVNKINKTTGELVTIANGTRMWIGTKTAHDLAVQQGTMPNNCMVSIIDDAAGEEAWQYSTSETRTGKTWIDGKPIYRIVIEKTVSFTGNAWNNTGISVSGVDTLCDCMMLSGKYACAGFYTRKGSSNQLEVFCVSDASWSANMFVLEYTKISD